MIDPRPDVSPAALQALRGDAIYCNVAGSGPTFPVARDAAETFRRWLGEVGMFSHAGYEAYNAALDATRADVAAAIGDPDGASRVALTQSATDGLDLAIASLELPVGASIVTTAEEHASALLPLFLRKRRGAAVTVLRYRDDEQLLAELEQVTAPRLIVVSLVSCRTGKVLPVARICDLARLRGAVVVVDAAQAAGQVPVDVRALRPDAVVLLGHKWLHGPLATGALWVQDPGRWQPSRIGWRSRSVSDLRGRYDLYPDARRFETGTVDAAAFVGLRQALAVHRVLGGRVAARIRALRAHFLARLAGTPYESLSRAEDPTGIVTLVPSGGDAAGIVTRVWERERVVVKHLAEPELPEAIRVSFWALHTEPELTRVADALATHARAVAA